MNRPRRDTFVSVVAPIRDEAGYVADFVMELHGVLESHYQNYEIIMVDDNSTDGSESILRSILTKIRGLRTLRLSRSFGRETAILAGLESAIGDYVVVMLAESDPAALIPMMVERCRLGASVVVGVEVNPPRRGWLGRLASSVFHWYCRRQLHLNLYPGSRYFRVFSRTALNAVLQIQDRVRNLRHLSGAVGFIADPFPYATIWRSKFPRRRRLSKDLSEGFAVIIANSKHPFRLATNLGLIASTLNLIYTGHCFLKAFSESREVTGWLILSLQQGVMFFVIFMILFILAEYIGLVLWETRARPSYFVSREEQSSPTLQLNDRRNVVNDSP